MTEDIVYQELFEDYLGVCNEALRRHRDCFPYDRIIHQIEFLLECHNVQTAIYDEDENSPEAYYDMVIENGQLSLKPVSNPQAENPWLLSKSYLESVTSHPESYIRNPAQLNWRWLTHHCVGV